LSAPERLPNETQLHATSLYWQRREWRDQDVDIRIQRKTLLGLLLTVLLHAVLLWLLRANTESSGMPADTLPASSKPLEISLLDEAPAAQPSEAEVTEQPTAPRAIRPKPPKPTEQPQPDIDLPAPPPPITLPPPEAPPTPALDLSVPQTTDLSSYMQQMRERRAAAQRAASGEASPPMSDAERRMANIQRNLQKPGTNGIFQIVSKGTLSAQFMFKGWSGQDSSRARSQLFEVSVPPGGDIERAMVQRMIALIRTHYSGDFNWESHRQNRVIVLSARLEDNAELEAFLLREFFG
jgi:hypothetical protein